MASRPRFAERVAQRGLAAADAAANRLYGWRANPLYQSGTLVVALLIVLLVTGLWLVLFYRVGSPYASVARIAGDPWIGRWMRAVHRYASDAAVVAVIVHALRMFAQGRSWGPRALAWLSGVLLLLLVFVCGWTGYVMVWDSFGEVLAREGARMLDTLPILSEPLSRAFTGERPVPSVFFFLNLFAHVGIPLGMLVVLWVHVSRLARPATMPNRAYVLKVGGVLLAAAIVWPLGIGAAATPFAIPDRVTVDALFAFWLPLSRSLSPGVALAGAGATALALLAVPLVTRRRPAAAPPPSVVDEKLCTGCRQCALDCPYEAITMIPRTDGRATEVARVDPALCVSCGICAGSCAPMGVGPEGRTGRDQLVRVREFLAAPERQPGEIVAICCERTASSATRALGRGDATMYPVDCAGSLHTSVIEILVRGGTGGVLVLSCPPRDCWNREGPVWLHERVHNDREAELQPRVDRRRVETASLVPGDPSAAREAFARLAARVRAIDAIAETAPAIDITCEPVALEDAS